MRHCRFWATFLVATLAAASLAQSQDSASSEDRRLYQRGCSVHSTHLGMGAQPDLAKGFGSAGIHQASLSDSRHHS